MSRNARTHSSYEYLTYFIKNMSLYQMLKLPLDSDPNLNLLNKVYKAIQLLDYFSFIIKNNEDDSIVKIPYFNFSISLLYHKTELLAKSATFNIFTFNRELFNHERTSNKNKNNIDQTLTYNSRFTIFHKMLKALTEEELNLYKLTRNIYDYKILKNEQEDLIFTQKFSKNSEFRDFLTFFNFKPEEIAVVIKMLSLILHISNLTLDISNSISESKLNSLKELLNTQELFDIKKILLNNMKLSSYLDFDTNSKSSEEKKVLYDYLPDSQFNQVEFMNNQIILMENLYERYIKLFNM